MTTNPYLEGNYGPVREELTAFDLPVTGTIPPELNGTLLRNGPNPISSDPATYHWFIGDGMLHGVELREGRAASYRNRWVRTDPAVAALGEEAPAGQAVETSPLGAGAANTHVVAHAGRILALEEAHLPVEVTADLATVGRYDFAGALRGTMTAHPKIDPVTGEMLFFGAYNLDGGSFLTYHVVDATGVLIRSEPIDFAGLPMVHDFNVTERHVVWMDLPVVLDADLLAGGFFPFSWQPDHGARLGVMPRAGGNADVQWFDIEPCYVFHALNAYDEGDRIVIDVARFDKMFAKDRHGPSGTLSTLDRWTIDLIAGKVLEERIDDRGQDFPRVADAVVGRRHRYGYTTLTPSADKTLQFGGLLRHDLHCGTTETHEFGPGRRSGEAVFVPASGARPGGRASDGSAAGSAAEGEGWLLSVVYDAEQDGSELVILDATDFAGPPVATVVLPQRVPFGFHGTWVPCPT